MFSGAGKEWSPTFGESWQVPQLPVREANPNTSFMPATPVMLIGFVLNTAWPRTILARAGFCEFAQASTRLKIAGLNGVPKGLKPKLGGKESLIPIKNCCDASATGPP